MIRYSLACDAGHRFDSWFADSAAFDDLAERGLVGCPTCGSADVAKTIMSPALVAKRMPVSASSTDSALQTPPQRPVADIDLSISSESHRQMRSFIAAFREKVLATTQDVGSRFPEEARRIHDGDVPHREIRGQATVEEARSLLEDGILVVPIPNLPEELN